MKCKEISSTIKHLVLEDEEDFGSYCKRDSTSISRDSLHESVVYHQVNANTDILLANRLTKNCFNIEGLFLTADLLVSEQIISTSNVLKSLKKLINILWCIQMSTRKAIGIPTYPYGKI